MNHSAKEIRNKLGLSKTEAGVILLGIGNRKYAHTTWAALESRESCTSGTDQYFSLLLYLIDQWPAAIKRFVDKVEKGEI